MVSWGRVPRYVITLPERAVRAAFAGVGGTVHETAQIVLPRFVRRSRFYEATAKNALRIATEFVGGVARGEHQPSDIDSAGRVAVKKTAGNFVEIGSIAAFGFSPLWLLAGASDVLHGSRVYLRALEGELAGAGLLEEGAHFGSVDQLIGALEGTTGTTARAIDLPPLELAELRRSLTELRGDVTSLPSPGEMMDLFHGLVALARHDEPFAAGSVERRRSCLRHVRAERRPRPPRHALSRGLGATAHGGIRRLRDACRPAVSRGGARPFRPRARHRNGAVAALRPSRCRLGVAEAAATEAAAPLSGMSEADECGKSRRV